MEELLIYLVFFIIYLAAQFLGARKKKRQPTPETGAAPDGSFSLEDALQEIREAMGGAPSEPEPTVLTAPPLDTSRADEPKRTPSIPRPTVGRPVAQPPAAALPVEPLAVERRAPDVAPPATPPRTAHPPGTRPTRTVRPGLRAQLSSREALQDAFVLSEVFGPPRALRR